MAIQELATSCGQTSVTSLITPNIDFGGQQPQHQPFFTPSTAAPVVICGQDLQSEPELMPVLLRGSIARSIYERMQREDQLRQLDKQKWYEIDGQVLNSLDEQLLKRFAQMDFDCETKQFLDICYEKSDQYFTHLFHSIARTILCLFMSSTSVNGLLGRGSMFVFSDEQLRQLLADNYLLNTNNINDNSIYSSHKNLETINIEIQTKLDMSSDKILLDLGAGDGKVTEILAKYFQKTFTTEISPVMRKILNKKGFNVLDIEEWHQNGRTYDLISCLNVLDRCDKPLTMLSQIKHSLRPKTGLLLLALVLPFSQYVEVNDGKRGASDHRPTEVLAIEGQTFEQQLVSFKKNVLTPNGLEIVKWTKLPYLCEGDLDLTFYWLYDVVLVLKPVVN